MTIADLIKLLQRHESSLPVVLSDPSGALLLTVPDDVSVVPTPGWRRGTALLLAPFTPGAVPCGHDSPAAPHKSAGEVAKQAMEEASA